MKNGLVIWRSCMVAVLRAGDAVFPIIRGGLFLAMCLVPGDCCAS